MIHRFRLFFYTKIAERKFYRIPYGTCCCGLSMDNHPILEDHTPRDIKEHTITNYLQSKIKEI